MFRRDKHVFVAEKTFVVAKLCLSRQIFVLTSFVATKLCLSREIFLSRQNIDATKIILVVALAYDRSRQWPVPSRKIVVFWWRHKFSTWSCVRWKTVGLSTQSYNHSSPALASLGVCLSGISTFLDVHGVSHYFDLLSE